MVDVVWISINFVVFVMVGGIVLLLFLFYGLVWLFLKLIWVLMVLVMVFGDGNLEWDVLVMLKDEFGELVRMFNLMVVKLWIYCDVMVVKVVCV